MKLKVTQNCAGRFSLSSSEKTHQFTMALFNDDNTLVSEGKNSAMIEWNGDLDHAWMFENPFDDMDGVFGECWKHANSLWSTKDYKGNALLFLRLYRENFESINANFITSRGENLERKIRALQAELEYLHEKLPDAISPYPIEKNVEIVKGWIKKDEEELAQMKEGSDIYAKRMETLSNKKEQLNKLLIAAGS